MGVRAPVTAEQKRKGEKKKKERKQYRAYLKFAGPLVQIRCVHHNFEDFNMRLQYVDEEGELCEVAAWF